MKKRKFHYGRLLALLLAAVIISPNLLPASAQAAGSALDKYDSTTDIGSQLLPSGEYTVTGGWRNEKIFEAVNYHQNTYNMTFKAIYQENESTTEDALHFVVAKAKDTYNSDAEVRIEIVCRGKDVHIFARQSSGAQVTIRDFFKADIKAGEEHSYAIRYSNKKIWLYVDDQAVITKVDLSKYSRYADVEPYAGLAFLSTGGTYSDLHLWGKGVEYYGAFPAMPSGNGNYADYMGVKFRSGTATTYENGVLQNTGICYDVVNFTKLPFTTQDTYAWSFEVNVEETTGKSWHGIRPIIRADEDFKNQYQLAVLEGAVILLYNSSEVASAFYKRTLGETDKFGVVVKPDAVSVWVNDILVLDNIRLDYELSANMGIKYEGAKATIKNMKLYYTEPTTFVKPESDPTIPQLTSAMYNAAKYMKVADSSKDVSYGNYTVKKISGTENKYTYKNIPMAEDADYTYRTKMTINSGFAKDWEGPRILFRTSKQGDIYLAFCKSRVIVMTGGNGEIESYPMTVELGKAYDVVINSNPDEVNVWIDGKLIFNRLQLSKTGEKTTAKAGIWYENCDATLADLKIYGESIVLTDEIFDLELDQNPYFNSATVPEKPAGNINHFENVKLSDSKSRARYENGVLKLPITSEYLNYKIVDQNGYTALNGLKRSDTIVWSYKVKASQISPAEIEGQTREDAAIQITVKQSDHPSGSNINYRTTFCMVDNRLELQIWQNSTKIQTHTKNDFVFEADKEYAIDMLIGPSWMKVWVDGELTFTAYDLPDYQLYFNFSAANIQADVYDFDMYKVEADKDEKVLDLKQETKAIYMGDTLKDTVSQKIPLAAGGAVSVLAMIGCIVLILAAAAAVVYGVMVIRKGKKSKEAEGEIET